MDYSLSILGKFWSAGMLKLSPFRIELGPLKAIEDVPKEDLNSMPAPKVLDFLINIEVYSKNARNRSMSFEAENSQPSTKFMIGA